MEAEVYAIKRNVDQRSEGSGSNNSINKSRAKKKYRAIQPDHPIAQPYRRAEASSSAPIIIDEVMTEVNPNDGNISTAAIMGDKPRRVRAPPRRLKVIAPVKDIWEKLGDSPAPLSLKDWVVLDKKVQKDLKDGLRFLGGRRPRKGKGKEVTITPVPVNLVEGENDSSD